MEIINPKATLSKVKFALFDFDGTISLIRQGWPNIMKAVMVENIIGGAEISASERATVEAEVKQYIQESTGILAIKQFQWLVLAVKQHEFNPNILTAGDYKKIYSDLLLEPVHKRIKEFENRPEGRNKYLVAGVREFLQALQDKGIKLFLASGTDYEFVVKEAGLLGVADFFGEHIYGAHGTSEIDSKEVVIQNIITENKLSGPELLVVGDGPVEIRAGAGVGAITLGVASMEDGASGINEDKKRRLITAGADIIILDFSDIQTLLDKIEGGL